MNFLTPVTVCTYWVAATPCLLILMICHHRLCSDTLCVCSLHDIRVQKFQKAVSTFNSIRLQMCFLLDTQFAFGHQHFSTRHPQKQIWREEKLPLVVYWYNTERDHSHLYNLIPGPVDPGYGRVVLNINCWFKNIYTSSFLLEPQTLTVLFLSWCHNCIFSRPSHQPFCLTICFLYDEGTW